MNGLLTQSGEEGKEGWVMVDGVVVVVRGEVEEVEGGGTKTVVVVVEKGMD